MIGDLLDGIDYPPWYVDALCAQVGGDWWFPERGGSTREAKRVCASCPVLAECGEYALANRIEHGVWGGWSDRERRKMLRRQAPPEPQPTGGAR